MNTNVELSIEPNCARCRELLAEAPVGEWNGRSLAEWRRRTRQEVGLAVDRPIIATGHQTMLWHPGILAKYLLAEAMAGIRPEIATANLIVDQHTGNFGRLDVPVRWGDGSLAVHTITLTSQRENEPMVRHRAFDPPVVGADLPVALPCVGSGIERILAAVAAHRTAGNAALQMASALADLMSPWVSPMPGVCASNLIQTSLAAALIQQMADDPRRCAVRYNEAVQAFPEGSVAPLTVTDDEVELPLWHLGESEQRRRAYDSDVRRWLDQGAPKGVLLPRALLLTAIVRMGMCDLFIHGTGGAMYDQAMERWLRDWLGVKPCPIAVATATLRLPLGAPDASPAHLESALHEARRAWHDPENASNGASPSRAKHRMVAQIEAAPRRSPQRRALFEQMHKRLAELRREYAPALEAAQDRARVAGRAAAQAPIINRRTWAFALYPDEMIDALAEAVAKSAATPGHRDYPTATAGRRC